MSVPCVKSSGFNLSRDSVSMHGEVGDKLHVW
jgi:hypothetical protein